MKLAVVIIVLGILIVVAAVLVTGWMIFHNQEQRQPVADPGPLVLAADQAQDQGDEEGVQDHREQVALEDHFFFPAAMS